MSVESRHLNTQRLKEYKSKMILFPNNANNLRKGHAHQASEACSLIVLSSLSFLSSPSGHFLLVLSLTHPLPLQVVKHARAMAITADIKKVDAFQTIRQALTYMRL